MSTLPIVPIAGQSPRHLSSMPSNKRRSCLDDLPPPAQSTNVPDHATAFANSVAPRQQAKKFHANAPIYPTAMTNTTHSIRVAQCDQNEVLGEEEADDSGLDRIFFAVRI